MARRVRDSNRDDEELGAPLAEICVELEADKEDLIGLMSHLGVRRDPVKPIGAWAVEKLGRLKLNGQLTGYSPLSRMVELEVLLVGDHRQDGNVEGAVGDARPDGSASMTSSSFWSAPNTSAR